MYKIEKSGGEEETETNYYMHKTIKNYSQDVCVRKG